MTDRATPQAAAVARHRARALPLERVRALDMRLPLLVAGAILLVASLALPYWHITLHAPQYPSGLSVDVYTYKMTGDVREVDGLNHYIGMMKLENAAPVERSISRIAVPLIALAAIASFWLRGRWRWLGVAPMLVYPVAFTVDLFAWLYHAGHSLDPHAALSSSIGEFTPRILGKGVIGQFSTEASFGRGFFLALLAVVLVLIATILKPESHDAPA